MRPVSLSQINMKLKPLKPKQHPQAAKIFWVLFPFLGFWSLFQFFKFVQKKHRFYAVKPKKKSPRILGLAAFTTFIFSKRKWFYLQYLAIAKDAQGQGFGSRTLRKIEAKAIKQKHDYFLLLSPPWRPKAQKFYLKKGYKRILWFIFIKSLK
jgi:GNAT superfamily N-acetyltransferase